MEEGFANILADELKNTIMSIRKEAGVMFKNTRPFRYEPPTDEQRLDTYMSITPEMDEELTTKMGQPYQDYKLKMADLYARRQTNA